MEQSSTQRGYDYMNLALLTDGLRAEREQGITIDVAYRYFTTARRKFILADTPGHIQYTRNMVTGASTADVALVLVDARKGLLEQSRRHAFLATLLRVPHIAVCVNKMDLVDWDQGVYEAIRDEFRAFATRLEIPDLSFFPVCALHGDNIVDRSENMPWYRGLPLLVHLEELHIAVRPQPGRRPLPGAVRGAAPVRRAPRLPGLRRARWPGACSGPATRWWCCPRG